MSRIEDERTWQVANDGKVPEFILDNDTKKKIVRLENKRIYTSWKLLANPILCFRWEKNDEHVTDEEWTELYKKHEKQIV